MASVVKDLPIHPRINFIHRGLSNIWYNCHQHPPSTSTCKVLLHLPKCPKAGIAAPLVIHVFFCHTARLPHSRGQLVRHPQALIGKTSICFYADNTSLRAVRADAVSRHALPYSRGQHVRHPQALIGEPPRILTLCFSAIRNQPADKQPPNNQPARNRPASNSRNQRASNLRNQRASNPNNQRVSFPSN
jgi:hypothetical protein